MGDTTTTGEHRLAGRVAWVTGAASGIGLATARRFAAEGAVVVGSDLAESDGWAEVAAAAPASAFHLCDVRDEAAQKSVAESIVADHGRIDIVMTAAGVAGGGPVHLVSLEDWQRVQDINLTGTMLTCKAALPAMIAQRGGSIITVASVEGLEGCEGGSTYNASKGGVVLLTKNLASDYGRLNIRANAICPGFIETPMFESVVLPMGERAEAIKQQHKLGRFGRADEIAGAAFFLASDDASFVTGVALPVDGGYVAGHSYGVAEMMGLA
ncbi:MAG: SDR family oxidoreductase [Acidimicrobiales bacterium]|nr:SDR family oxidoreductase [Acidimicrobiales bacterium]